MRKELGYIRTVAYGFGGYQGVQFGISFGLGNDSWGVGDFWGAWGMKPDSHHQWTEQDQIQTLGIVALRIRDLLKAAKAETVDELQNKPVEVEFDGNVLKSWRILTEVL